MKTSALTQRSAELQLCSAVAGHSEHIFVSRRVGAPMPLGFTPHPEGIFDNSPTFQRWVREFRGAQVPQGRLKPHQTSAVPTGLIVVPGRFPNVETLGYYRMSLRDKDSGTFGKSLPRSNPSGIVAPAL